MMLSLVSLRIAIDNPTIPMKNQLSTNILLIWLISFIITFSISIKHISSLKDIIVNVGAASVSSTIGTALFVLFFEKVLYYILKIIRNKL